MDIEIELLSFVVSVDGMTELIDAGISSEYFYDQTNAEMFESAYEYFLASKLKKATTVELLRDEFPMWFQKNEWSSSEYEPSVIISKVKERYRRVNVQNTLRSLGSTVMEDPELAVKQALEEFSRIQYTTSTRNRLVDYGDTIDLRVDQYYDRVLLEGEESRAEPGIPLLWDMLTEYTHGIKPPEVGVLVALPNTGKSWVMAQAALTAARAGVPTYLANLENSAELTMMRLDCLASGIPFTAYERGTLTRVQTDKLEEAKEELKSLKGLLFVDSPRKIAERGVYELYTRAQFMGAKFVVGDQLSWVTPRTSFTGSNAPTLVMSEVITDIASVSRELGMSSLWAAQFNRAAGTMTKGRAGLQHIALSTTIEQIVDWAFSLSRSKEMRENNSMLFEILKSRRTDLRSWLCAWELTTETDLRPLRVFNS